MKQKTALIIILIIALGGIIFSGYLSYYTLLGPGCAKAIISCGTKPVDILGVPQCVYGLAMYLILAILSIVALKKDNKIGLLKASLVIAVIGTLFAASLTYYELFVIETGVAGLPACAYGFFMYLLIFIFTLLGFKDKSAI